MHEFDHAGLANRLAAVPERARHLFAALVAERLFPLAVEFFAEIDEPVVNKLHSALDLIWSHRAVNGGDEMERGILLEECMKATQMAAHMAAEDGFSPLTGVQRKAAANIGVTALRPLAIGVAEEQAYHAFLAENAAAAIAYGLRAIESGDPRDSAWAGQRGYDTVDRFAMVQESVGGIQWTEEQILAHPAVQKELQRQLDDIEALESLGGGTPPQWETISKLREVARQQALSIFD